MRVLVLGNKDLKNPDEFPDIVRAFGDEVILTYQRFTPEDLIRQRIEFIVSYRYRCLLKEPVLSDFRGRCINMHPSFLPWCRGYFPNFWSFVDGTPQGVTIHDIDATIDTGDIIVQKEFKFSDNDTLRTSYDALHAGMYQLFQENWTAIKAGTLPRTKQSHLAGTLHYKADFDRIQHLLPNGWDTSVGTVRDLARAGVFKV